ncbi:barstar family protein [Pseudomonas chlororaphis]|uniref:Ribonuclease inhibitor n=1 Tax=Pseudomonas chlororaphis TaxID=587753 RepID=A0AAX3FP79_9PSED|nr:barstar family protein [Pseudomonas chlororaphis]AZC37962.1 Barstar, ribonuclease (Barnase) inhibitor [Pseudomonas chlororaphis subsp. piscium]AZC44509.1 Barstar, ribonuclease (Barnase) inhibitor [Pseudomonas chlororaphis subsp. piscium]WDG70138.1 barstar family protein [Pseudomonas chlororaphis]WDH32077.1 barstar family protein [Pseudomonas chlororaphis]WDH68663.1 barstar family protein [Pseudomonas chlororaphis]
MTRLQRVDIDLSAVASTAELHATLRDALDFPDWYGANWDAFWDAITGLVEMPVQLKFHGWNELATRLPRDAQLLRQCLEKMTVHYPEFASQVTFD